MNSHEVSCFNIDFVDLAKLNHNKNLGQSFNNSSTNENKFYSLLLKSNILQVCLDDSHLHQLNTDQLNAIKNLIRNSNWEKDDYIRKHFWGNLSIIIEQKFIVKINKSRDVSDLKNEKNIYNGVVDQIMGKERDHYVDLPKFSRSADQHLNFYYLNQNGKNKVKQVLCVLEFYYPEITFCPIILPICSLLLHYMPEYEAFHLLSTLYKTNDHLLLTKKSWKNSSHILKKLFKKNFKSDYQRLEQNSTEPLETLFQDWNSWIFDSFALDYLIRIMDCYLFEGQKIFFRIGLIVAHAFSRSLKVKNSIVNKDSFKEFIVKNNSFKSVNQLLTMSFNIRNFKRAYIQKLVIDLQKISNIEPVDSCEFNEKNIFLKEVQTTILSHSNFKTIWNWLPDRLTLYHPEVLFSTDVNGTSMNTLLNVLDDLEYCLIVVKTFQGEIFGAFCSCNWIDRRNKVNYFGNGETFLFTIEPSPHVYYWVGKKIKDTQINQELFVRVKNAAKISIGGGNHDGLSINSDLSSGSTNKCTTFDNQPLSNDINFDISVLEVISFKHH